MSVQYVFIIAALALLLGLIASLVLVPQYTARMREMAASPAMAPVGDV